MSNLGVVVTSDMSGMDFSLGGLVFAQASLGAGFSSATTGSQTVSGQMQWCCQKFPHHPSNTPCSRQQQLRCREGTHLNFVKAIVHVACRWRALSMRFSGLLEHPNLSLATSLPQPTWNPKMGPTKVSVLFRGAHIGPKIFTKKATIRP